MVPDDVLPPLKTSLSPSLSPLAVHYLSQAWLLTTWISLVLLLFDWLVHLGDERRYVWRGWSSGKGVGKIGRGFSRWERASMPGRKWKIACFAMSRYLTLIVTVWAVVHLTVGRHSSAACSGARALPFGLSLAVLFTHLVLAYRTFCVFSGRSLVLFWSLVMMAVIDVGLQLASDVLVQPVFLTYTISSDVDGSALVNLCYLTPTTTTFAIAFIFPSVFGHVVLVLTLYASWRHWTTEKALAETGSAKTSLMSCLRKQHAEYVLAICLINFANVVLVLQTMAMPLIYFLPSLVLTHLLLSRLFFTLERRLSPSSSAASTPQYTLPHIAVTPTALVPPSGGRLDQRLSRADRRSQRISAASIDFSFVPMRMGSEGRLTSGVPTARTKDSAGTLREQRLSKLHTIPAEPVKQLEIRPFPQSHALPSRAVDGMQEILLTEGWTLGGEFSTATTTGAEPTSPLSPTSTVPLFHLPTREIVRQASQSNPHSPVSPPREALHLPPSSTFVVSIQPAESAGASRTSVTSPPSTLAFPVFDTATNDVLFLAVPTSSSPNISVSLPSQRPSFAPRQPSVGGYSGDESSSPTPSPSPSPSPSRPRSPINPSSNSHAYQTGSSSSFSTSTAAQHALFSPPQPPPPASSSNPDLLNGRDRAASKLSVQSASQVEGYLSHSSIVKQPVIEGEAEGAAKEKEKEATRRARREQVVVEGKMLDKPEVVPPVPPLLARKESSGWTTAYESAADPMMQ